MKKLVFLFGMFFLIIGLIPIFLYMNLLYYGYTFNEFINFIIKKVDLYYALFGFVILNVYFFKWRIKNE